MGAVAGSATGATAAAAATAAGLLPFAFASAFRCLFSAFAASCCSRMIARCACSAETTLPGLAVSRRA